MKKLIPILPAFSTGGVAVPAVAVGASPAELYDGMRGCKSGRRMESSPLPGLRAQPVLAARDAPMGPTISEFDRLWHGPPTETSSGHRPAPHNLRRFVPNRTRTHADRTTT